MQVDTRKQLFTIVSSNGAHIRLFINTPGMLLTIYYSLPVLACATIVRTEFKHLLAPLPHASSVKNHPRLHNTTTVSIRQLPGLKLAQDNLRCLRLTSAIA